MKWAGQGEETVIKHNLSRLSVIRRKSLKQLFSIPWPEKFKSKTVIDERTGCWNWIGATHHPPGFPQYKYGIYAGTSAHRFAYELVHGRLLLPLDVDHKCQNKLCVNPNHLRAITHQRNCQLRRKRARVPGSQRWLKEQVAK